MSAPAALNWNDLRCYVGSNEISTADLPTGRGGVAQAWRMRVRSSLPCSLALALHDALKAQISWEWVFQRNGVAQSIPQSQTRTLARAQVNKIWSEIHNDATQGFQFSFRKYSMIEALRAGKIEHDALRVFIHLIANSETLSTIRALTGRNDIARVDAQATRYDAGDFLTTHTDDNDAKFVRRVAYVLNLSPNWRADWGGLLLFRNEQGQIIDTFVPEFNTLNLFSVPQPHSVSMVAPFAGEARLAITGWFTA